MYCSHCGKAIDGNCAFCSNCGMRLNTGMMPEDQDHGARVGFAVLGFFVPLAGLILYLVYEKTQPEKAKAAAKGALIGFITKILLGIVCAVLYFVFAASFFRNILMM